jgi:hypothetical protein
MQANSETTWDEFTARRTGGDLSVPSVERRPAKPSALASLLLEAIQATGVRRGRLSEAERIREQTLLGQEVLATDRPGFTGHAASDALIPESARILGHGPAPPKAV